MEDRNGAGEGEKPDQKRLKSREEYTALSSESFIRRFPHYGMRF